MTPTRRAAALLAATALVLAGCDSAGKEDSSETDPSSKAEKPGSSQESATADSGSRRDRSAELLDAKAPGELGRATGKWKTSATDTSRVTLVVRKVHVGEHHTVLTFSMDAIDEAQVAGVYTHDWTLYPTIVDDAGDKAYGPLTYTKPDDTSDEPPRRCICTEHLNYAKGTSTTRTALYPKLPASASTVKIRLSGFKDIPVEVSR